MHSNGLSIELNGAVNFVRLNAGDWSVRVGAWTVTLMWGGNTAYDGLYVEDGAGSAHSRHWTWADMRARLVFWRNSEAVQPKL